MKYYSILNLRPIKAQEGCYEHFEKQYLQIPPFSKWLDEDGKEHINDTSDPILVEIDPVNIYAKIQSYKDSCDIAKIVDRLAATNSLPTIVDFQRLTFADISDLPKDKTLLLNKISSGLKKDRGLTDDESRRVYNGEDINKIINDVVERKLKAMAPAESSDSKEGDK